MLSSVIQKTMSSIAARSVKELPSMDVVASTVPNITGLSKRASFSLASLLSGEGNDPKTAGVVFRALAKKFTPKTKYHWKQQKVVDMEMIFTAIENISFAAHPEEAHALLTALTRMRGSVELPGNLIFQIASQGAGAALAEGHCATAARIVSMTSLLLVDRRVLDDRGIFLHAQALTATVAEELEDGGYRDFGGAGLGSVCEALARLEISTHEMNDVISDALQDKSIQFNPLSISQVSRYLSKAASTQSSLLNHLFERIRICLNDMTAKDVVNLLTDIHSFNRMEFFSSHDHIISDLVNFLDAHVGALSAEDCLTVSDALASLEVHNGSLGIFAAKLEKRLLTSAWIRSGRTRPKVGALEGLRLLLGRDVRSDVCKIVEQRVVVPQLTAKENCQRVIARTC